LARLNRYVDTTGMHGIGEGKDIYCGPNGQRGMLASLVSDPEVTIVVVASANAKRFVPQYACCAILARD